MTKKTIKLATGIVTSQTKRADGTVTIRAFKPGENQLNDLFATFGEIFAPEKRHNL